MDYDSLAQRLKTLRKGARLSMKELGKRLGYSYQWVDNIEGGRRRPDITDIERFAEACGHKVVFEIAPSDAVPAILTEADRRVVDAARQLSEEDRARLIEAIALLPRARPGAFGAAVSVLQNLQEAPAAPAQAWRVVGDDPDA